MNHYQRLGVVTNASQGDIKRAYRELVKKYHPDLHPNGDTHELMQQINEAYEVLSDLQSRSMYDLGLAGYTVPIEKREETEEEKYRREFKRRKAHEERVHMENVIRLKYKFYKAERFASYVFFAIGILFTIDYFIYPNQATYPISSMGSTRYQTKIEVVGGQWWMADWDLLKEFEKNGGEDVILSYSAIFNIPARIQLAESEIKYRINGTLHSFRNIITLIILVFSAIVIKHKEYNDFRLTCGLMPVLLVIFQLLLVSFGA
jgi:hypothetical protein